MSRKFKRCLITGIAGSGGSYLAEYILDNVRFIKIFGIRRHKGYADLLKQKYKKRIHLLKFDLKNFDKLKKIIKKIKPDLIFHLASNADVKASFKDPLTIVKNNTEITLNLLEVIRKVKSKALFILCSTSEVYGNVKKNEIPILETQKMNPASPYAVSKAFQDMLAQVYYKAYGLKIIITRMFSYSNPRRVNLFQTSFADQIAKIEKNKKQNKLKHGNLKSIRSFIDINDAMSAYWQTALNGKIGEIYNIGGSTTLSVKEVLDKLLNLSKVKIKKTLDKSLLRPIDVTLQIPSVKKFKKHTGWMPKVSFSDSIINLLNYRRNLR